MREGNFRDAGKIKFQLTWQYMWLDNLSITISCRALIIEKIRIARQIKVQNISISLLYGLYDICIWYNPDLSKSQFYTFLLLSRNILIKWKLLIQNISQIDYICSFISHVPLLSFIGDSF